MSATNAGLPNSSAEDQIHAAPGKERTQQAMIAVSLLSRHKGRPPEDRKVITAPSQTGLGGLGELLSSLRPEKAHLTLALSRQTEQA